jgi:hypothetical protein
VNGGGTVAFDGFYHVSQVELATGTVTTLAGNGEVGSCGDGDPATAAEVGTVFDVAADAAGNLFLVDQESQYVRRVEKATGIITTVAVAAADSGDGRPATSVGLDYDASDVTADGAGNVFIAARGRIRRVDATTGIISTVAGLECRGSAATAARPRTRR